MNSETLNIKLRLDLSDVQKGAKQVKTSLNGIADKVKQSLPQIKSEGKKAEQSLTDVSKASNKVKKALNDVGKEAKESLSGVATESNKITSALTAMGLAGGAGKTITDTADKTQKSMAELQGTLENIQGLSFWDMVVSNLANIGRFVDGAKGAFKDFGASIAETMSVWKAHIGDGENTGIFSNLKSGVAGIKFELGNLKKSLGEVKKNFSDTFTEIMGASPKVVMAIAKIVVAVVALGAAIKNVFTVSQLGKEINVAAQQAGFSAQAYQEWSYVLEKVGIEASELTEVMKTLTESQVDVIDGNEDMINAYAQLGMSVEQVKSMNQEELWTNTIRALQNVENTTQRTAIAYKLFSEDTAKLTTVLNMTNGETQQLISTYHALGGAMSKDLIQKSSVLQSSLVNLRAAWQGLRNTLAQWLIPAVIAVVNWLTKAIIVVNAFLKTIFNIDTTPMTENLTTGMNGASGAIAGAGDAANNTIKSLEKLKRTTMGFDELNVVTNPNTSSSGDASGGGAGALGGAGGGIGGLGSSIFDESTQELVKFQEKVDKFMDKWGTAIKGIAIALSALTMAKFLGQLANAVGLSNQLAAALSLKGIGSGIGALVGKVTTFFAALKGGQGIATALASVFPKLSGAISTVGGALATLGGGSIAAGLAIVVAIVAALASVVYFLYENWGKVTEAVQGFFATNIGPKLEGIKQSWEDMKTAIVDAGKAIWNALPPEVQEWLSKVWQGIKDVIGAIGDWFAQIDWLEAIGETFEFIGGLIFSSITASISGALSALTTFVQGFVEITSGIVQIVAGGIELIVKLFSGDLQGAKKAWEKMWDGVLSILKGMYKVTIGVVAEWVQGVTDWFKELLDSLGILSKLEKGVKDIWNNISGWFKKNVASKFTTKYWADKWGTITSGAKSAFNGVISVVERAVNAIINKINTLSWNIPDWVPVIGGGKFGFNFKNIKIPRLAEGGIVTSSTIANIGERGAEGVFPLTGPQGKAWMRELASELATQMGANGNKEIVIKFGETEFGRATYNAMNGYLKQQKGVALA